MLPGSCVSMTARIVSAFSSSRETAVMISNRVRV